MKKFELKNYNGLKIRFNRLKNKLKEWNRYYNFYMIFLGFTFYIFKPIKKYILFNRKKSWRWLGLISYSIFDIFWFKSWYIDDFFVSKKLRWKWIWKILLKMSLNNIREVWAKYAFLLWNATRKESLWMYKKFWFTVVSAWFIIVAYKKINKKR